MAEEIEKKKSVKNGWIGGLVLILIGLVFIVKNLTGFSLDNWWALFIFIPAIATFATAWRNHRAGHGWGATIGSLIGGLCVTAVALIFLFQLDWGRIWPLFVILAGVGALAGSFTRKKDKDEG